MPALATLEELQAASGEIQKLKEAFPEAGEAVIRFLKANRKIGYKNLCKMFTGEATPESLKE